MLFRRFASSLIFSFSRKSAILLLFDTSSLANYIAFFYRENLSSYLISFKKELSFLIIITILFVIYFTIAKLTFSFINSSLFITPSSIVSTNFASTNNFIRIIYYLYSFVIDTNSIAISRKVVIIVDYIASRYSRFKIKSIRVNVVESSFFAY